jgi:trans-2,3-dihydro-3-hydroxyanthranilate isomerase
MAASYDFVQLDVFTRTPLADNPVAIFTDARGLTDKQMQALAREMNLSETTFILPREPELEATYGKRVSASLPPGKNCRLPDIQR